MHYYLTPPATSAVFGALVILHQRKSRGDGGGGEQETPPPLLVSLRWYMSDAACFLFFLLLTRKIPNGLAMQERDEEEKCTHDYTERKKRTPKEGNLLFLLSLKNRPVIMFSLFILLYSPLALFCDAGWPGRRALRWRKR